MPRAALVFSVFLLVAESVAVASSARKLSLDELARQADVIVKGRVQKLQTKTSSDRSTITTAVTLAVDEQWKGAPASSLSIEQPGGSSGGITQRVAGAAEFALDEKVIVFLKREGRGHYVTVGGRQGKFTVKTDAQTGSDFVEDLSAKRWQPDEFLARLQEALSR